jgi:hypothetical protein
MEGRAMALSAYDKLVRSLRPYVSKEDVDLDRYDFLIYVRDRIDADLEAMRQAEEKKARDRNADHIDGYDRDDLGESPDY